MTINDYLSTTYYNYGGKRMCLGAIIADLQRIAKARGLSDRCVAAYVMSLQANEKSNRLRK